MEATRVTEAREKVFSTKQIVVTTNFLYRNYHNTGTAGKRDVNDIDGVRGDLALQLLSKAMNVGVSVVASDGGSSLDFLKKIEQFKSKGLTLVETDSFGRAIQRRDVFERASGILGKKIIVYLQPEKFSLINYLGEISQPILKDRADIVIPKREPALFEKSYPDYMRESELRVNKTYDWLMRKNGLMTKNQSFDWFFGPVVFKNDPKLISLFLKKYEATGPVKSRTGVEVNPEKRSGSHYLPIIEALYRGKRVVSVEVPFVYPESQKASETSEKNIENFRKRRQEDADAYRLEALHFIAFLKGDSRGKIKEEP